MKTKIEITDENGNAKLCDIESIALYDALARLNGLTEVKPNQWTNEHGEHYALTKYGFRRYGSALQSYSFF